MTTYDPSDLWAGQHLTRGRGRTSPLDHGSSPTKPNDCFLSGRSCEACGRRLTGRKHVFCSDRCRMRARRQARRIDLLNTIDATVEELRIELGVAAHWFLHAFKISNALAVSSPPGRP